MTKLTKRLSAILLGAAMTLGIGASFLKQTLNANAATYSASLVTNLTSLATGDQIVIVNTAGTYALSQTQNTNNRGSTSVTVVNNAITSFSDSTVEVLTLGGSSGAWTFYDTGEAGYLNATNTTSKNYLRTVAALDAYAYWSIALNGNYEATVTCTGKASNNVLMFNASTSPTLFSAYTSGQTAIKLFKAASATSVPPTGVTVSLSSSTVEVSYSITATATITPSSATDQTVTWSSDNVSVATVSASGVVTGVSAGTASIIATCNGDTNITGYSTVTVVPGAIYIYCCKLRHSNLFCQW